MEGNEPLEIRDAESETGFYINRTPQVNGGVILDLRLAAHDPKGMTEKGALLELAQRAEELSRAIHIHINKVPANVG